jgi:uncharacterized membrane protein YhiD involved in acid resistance
MDSPRTVRVAAGVTRAFVVGAGVIMRRGGAWNQLSDFWATAGLGLAIGLGEFDLAYIVLAVILAAQFSTRWAGSWIDKRSG